MKRLVLAASLIVLTAVLAAQQGDRDRAEALARRASDRLQALQQEAERLASDERTLLGDLRKLEVAREITVEELHEAAARADASAKELQSVNERVRQLEHEDVSERPQLRARVIELYKLGQGRYLRLLLSTSDVKSVGQASRMVAAMAKRDRDRVIEHERTLADLRTSRATLQARGKTLAAARLDAENARAGADHAVAARNELIGNIDRARDLNAQLSGELTAAHQKLQATIRQMSTGGPADATVLPLRPFRGDLDWPVAGAVRQRFGRGSSGIEIAADDGTPVRAVHEGTVAFAGPFAGFGNLVIVQHDADTFSLYGNLSDTAVALGARIEQGDTLGSVGASTTGPPGLYFELRVSGQPVDPVQWLKKQGSGTRN